ncbi:putative hydrolase of the HAD superfamily [Paenibacillus phyllosphaerae]|uniref:Putative hydrolase of the HAD superfamily n=1 Tax=Paenibacillus phyllosphaerae TaxID=274593 RepID=A0A7W5B0U2_9BACL|nr:HAD family hydrolase [Paenibacillus phyllosphaerae]MBB3112044.1 putative hydrolase of the HAD superfamily [Paenibacillus phyllosphaerae]
MMYETYIFDLYGTLIDIVTDEESPEVWERLAVHFRYSGMQVGPEELKSAVAEEIGRQLEAGRARAEHPEFAYEQVFAALAQQWGREVSAEWLHETVRWFRILSMRKLALYDGALELLQSLRQQGKKLYLLSNGQKTFIEAELTILGIKDLFDGLAISSEAGVCKPDPLFYLYLEEQYGADLSSAIMIGNDPRTDMEGAHRIGIDACYIHSESSPEGIAFSCRYELWDGDLRKVPGSGL